MSTIELNDFTERFGQLLLQSWTNEDYLNKLIAEPGAALAEAGLALPASVAVRVERGEPADGMPSRYEEGDFEKSYAHFVEAAETGSFTLVIPETPELELGELKDSELETVSGGANVYCCIVFVS
jgi:hypothetical protein